MWQILMFLLHSIPHFRQLTLLRMLGTVPRRNLDDDMSGENGAAHDAWMKKCEYYEDCYNGYEDGEEEADFDDSQSRY